MKVVTGFPEQEELCRKVEGLISPGSEFLAGFRACAGRVLAQRLTLGMAPLSRLPWRARKQIKSSSWQQESSVGAWQRSRRVSGAK